MITLEQYFGGFFNHVDATLLRKQHAETLLGAVNELMEIAIEDGVSFPVNPVTKSQVSGADFGGFRPQDCPIGSPASAHKTGHAVDLYDPTNEIDAWCLLNLDKLEACGIYLEDPKATNRWSHWSTRRPGSGNRVFVP